MTTARGKRPRLADETRRLMWDAAMRAATEKDAPGAKKVAADLQTSGHFVSEREVQRTFARARTSLEDSSDPWHIEKATSAEELELILPVIASRIEEARDAALSIEEVRIIVAVRRAMPKWEPWQADQFARNYRAARHSEWPSGPGSPWTVANMEAFIAAAHVERVRPGSMQKAFVDGLVPSFGFVRVSTSLAATTTKERKRKGGTGHGKTSAR